VLTQRRAEFESLEWLRTVSTRWTGNGPTSRIFSKFRDEDLDRPIIDLFERVARRHRNRIRSRIQTHLSLCGIVGWPFRTAETIRGRNQPGDLIGIVLRHDSMFPLAILACLAAGRPFVALDPHYPGNWLSQVLETRGQLDHRTRGRS